MQLKFVRWLVLLTIAACPAVAAVEIWSAAQQVRTEDHNGDGRPDVWRRYDSRGRLVEVDVDSNFDGRPDVQEYYDRGTLVRRESDRNFNGQADFVEEFDLETHARTRSVIDIDYDGTADLLVLFRDGAPVFSKRTSLRGAGHPPAASPAADQNGMVRLARMTDPFEADTAVRAERTRDSDECSGVSPPGGSCPIVFAIDPKPTVTSLVAGDQPHSLTAPLRSSPRAPPVSS